MKLELTLSNLKELDFGKADVAFKRHLERCVEDCVDRPGDGNARTVTLQFTVKPEKSDTAACDNVNVQMQIASKIPAHKTKVYQCAPRGRGSLVFDAESPEDIRQGAFSDLPKENNKNG